MASPSFGAFVRFKESSGSNRASTSKPYQLHDHEQQQVESPSTEELDAMPIGPGARYTGPSSTQDKRVVGAQVIVPEVARPALAHSRTVSGVWPEPSFAPSGAQTPNELEMSRPTSPLQAAEIVQSWKDPTINKWRVFSSCVFLFCNGMNDSAPGALLPYMETHYNVGYAIVSLIFIANAFGFILAAFFVHAIDSKFGRAKTLMFADGLCLVSYILMGLAPPFPVFVLAFFIAGIGMATGLALCNVFLANLANATVLLGTVQGLYGVGGIIAPIIATQLVTHGILFSRFYFIVLGSRVISFIGAGFAFRNFERELAPAHPTLLANLQRSASRQVNDQVEEAPKSTLVKALKNRTTLIGALFIFAYQGAEVSISGWVISFLISYRDGNPAQVGNVTSGFWGGITLGRFVLSYFAHRIGEKRFAYGLILGAILFQLLVWLVPNVIGSAVAVALLGVLLGPIYPCGTTVFARLLPRSMQNTALAFISSAGSSGGAVAPFLTGLLAQTSGTWVLHPVCVSLFVVMIVCWAALPRVGKRRE